jgi:cell division protease FtsH
VNDSYKHALEILTQYRDKLDAVAAKLLESETLTKDEFLSIFPTPVPKVSGTPVIISN